MKFQFPFGLGDPPTTVYLYVEASDDTGDGRCPWHTFNFDTNTKTPIRESALYGYLTEIKLKIKYFKGKEGFKITFRMKTPREYVIQSGVETNFTRKLLLCLEQFDVTQPMCISAEVGDSESVVFATLWDIEGNLVKAKFDKDRQLLPLVNELQKRLGCPVQTIKQLRDEYAAEQDRKHAGEDDRGRQQSAQSGR